MVIVEGETRVVIEHNVDRTRRESAAQKQARAAAAAHELCNHLQVVTSAFSIIRCFAGPTAPPSFEFVLRGAQTSIERAARLCRALVDTGGVDSRAPFRFQIAERLMALRDTIQLAAGPRVEISMSIAEDIPDAYCVVESFDDAILNIVVNGARAMPEGGTFSFTVCSGVIASDPLPCTVLTITDTGYGMRPEIAARAFESLFTTRAPGEGSGVGLAMVADFAQSAGGSVALSSRLGVGTVVTLCLPGRMRFARRSDTSD